MLGYILCIFSLLLIFVYFNRGKRNPNQPTGPKGSFIFGVLFQFDINNLHFKLYEWSAKYGEIFQFKILGRTFVSLNTSGIIRDVFMHEPNATITAARPPTYYGKYMFENYSDLAYASPSKEWTKRRKISYQLLHAYGEGLTYLEKTIQMHLRRVKEEMRKLDGRNLDPNDLVEEFIFNILEVMIIGRSFGRHGKLQVLLSKLDRAMNVTSNLGIDVIYSLFPFLRFLPLSTSRTMDEVQQMKKTLMSILADYAAEETEEKGIYHSLIELVKEKDSEGKQWFTENNLIHLIINMFGAGYLTTRATLISMIRLLAKRPELQRSLQQEIDNVIGSEREPCLGDREKCPLTEAVIMETLRYISHVPVSIWHVASETCYIKGHQIDKGTVIIPNLWTAHHRDEDWDEPFSFNPRRFLDEEGNLLSSTAPNRKKLLVFGCGKRLCVGEVFAKSRLFLFLSTLMQTVTIREPDDETLSDLDPKQMIPGIVLQPDRYKIKLTVRSR